MTEVRSIALLSDEEEDVIEDQDPEEELRLQESIRKDLLTEFSESKPGKLTRESISHNREPMRVFLRVRPFTDGEVDEGESQDCMVQENTTTLLMQAPKNSFAFKSSQRGMGEMSHKFSFSKIFDEDTSQKTFFDETMLATVKDFIDGQNCLVFTYGVTNSGKTYTIQGFPQDGGILPRALDVIFNSIENRQFSSLRLKPRYFCDVVRLSEKQMKREEDIKTSVLSLGNVPPVSASYQASVLEGESMTDDSLNSDTSRASYSTANDTTQDCSKLSESKMSVTKDMDVTGIADQNFYDEIDARIPDDTVVNVEAQGPVKFSVWVSFAEIYNECMYDLLEPLPKDKKIRRQVLKLAEDKNGSIYIKGLKQIQVASADEAYRILKVGQRNLSIASTKLNHCSSRSHCIFSIKVLRVVDVDDPHVARVSHLSFCDLAGSERYTRTQNTGDRLKEAGNINTSLLTLGKCIHALRYNQNHPKTHPKIIPFRESKLTRLFQSFFLGKGKASMVVNVNQCASGFDETMHVLKFSATAKQVTTVTSKLDNKWREPPKKSTRPLRNVSLALNQALDARIKGQRPSVPWATPGTIAQVMKETGHGMPAEDTVFEEEEEDIIEESDDEMEEGIETPVAKGDNPSKIQCELLAVIEVLKQKLVESKADKFNLETKIREEVCQEMAEQLVEIEQDFNERLEEDKQRAEEVFEKRLEIYAKSVSKPKANKRARLEEDTSDGEQVSIALLAAEQNKVKDRDTQIEKLNSDLHTAEQSLKEFEDYMHDKMEKREEEFKIKLADLEEQLSGQSKEVKDVAAVKELLTASEEKMEKQENEFKRKLADLEEQLSGQSKEVKDVAAVKTELAASEEKMEKREEEFKRKLAEMEEMMSDQSKQVDDVAVLKSELTASEEQMKEREEEFKRKLAEMEEKLSSQSKEVGDVTALKTELAASQQTVENQENKFQRKLADLNEQLSGQSKKVDDVSALKDQLAASKKKMEILEDEFKRELADLKEKVSDQAEEAEDVAALKAELTASEEKMEKQENEFKKKLEDLKEQLSGQSKEVKDVAAVKELLAASEEKVEIQEDEFKRKLADLKEKLSDQAAELEDVAALKEQLAASEEKMEKMEEEFKSKLADLEEQLSDRSKEIEDVAALKQQLATSEETLKMQEKMQAVKEQLTKALGKNEDSVEEVDRLKLVVASAKQALDDSQTEMDTARDEYEAKAAEFETQMESITQVVANLQKAVELSQKQNAAEMAEQKKSFEDAMKEQEQASTKALEDKTEAFNKLEAELASLRQNSDGSEKCHHEQVKELQSTICSQDEKLSSMKQSFAAKEDELTSLNEQLDKRIKELEANVEKQQEELKEHCEASEELENKIEELSKQNGEEQSKADRLHDLEEEVNGLKGLKKQVDEKEKEIQERDQQIEDLYSQLEEEKTKIKCMEETMAAQLCAEIKSHEEAQQEMRTAMLTHAQNETEAKQLSQEQEEAMEDLKVIVEKQHAQIKKLEGTVSAKEDEIIHLAESSSAKTSSSSDEKSNPNTNSRMSKMTSSTSLASTTSTISTTSCEDDDDVILIEPEDQVGYKAGRLSRVEIDATPLQKKNSRKGRAPRGTRTSTRASRKRGGDEDTEYVSGKKRTRASSKTSLNEEIENQGEDEKGSSDNQGSSQRRGPLARINEYLQNSPIGKSAKRLVETATGVQSPTPETAPESPPPRAVEMDTFVPSLVPDNKRRKRKLYKTDISAPFECSPFEIVNVGDVKPAESSGAVITRKLRSRTKKY